MTIYLQDLNYEIWEVICDGPFIPMTENEVGDDIRIRTPSRTDVTLINLVPKIESKPGMEWNLDPCW